MKKIFNLFGSKPAEGPGAEAEASAESKEMPMVEKSPGEDYAATLAEIAAGHLDNLPEDIEDNQARVVADLGERHELISARLGQVAEILHQLADAHRLVDWLGEPIADTFLQHQAMAGQNVALQRALDRANTENSTLRERASEAATKAATLELELRHANESRVQLKAAYETAEENLRLSAGEVRVRDATIADLQQRLNDLKAEFENVSDDLAEASMRWQQSEDAHNAIALQLRQEREDRQALEREHDNLQTTIQHTVSEVAQMSRRVAEAEDAASKARARALQVEVMLAEAQSEKVKLLGQVNEMEQSISEERRSLAVKADGMRGRSVMLETLLNQAREELTNQADALREALRKGAEMGITINRLEARAEKAMTSHARAEEEKQRIEQARFALVERVEIMTKAIRAKDAALKRAEDVSENLELRLSHLEERSAAKAGAYESQISELADALEREKTQRALLEGSLDAMRQEKMRLQRELIQYRSAAVDESLAKTPQKSDEPPASDNVAQIYPA